MCRSPVLVAVSILAIMFLASGAWADNITIPDTILNSTFTPAPLAGNPGGEDQEVETGMVNNQSWDLEAFLLTGNTLSIVGGWNFIAGQYDGTALSVSDRALYWDSGDVFIGLGDLTDPILYGATAPDVNPNSPTTGNDYNYDFVLDIDWENSLGFNGGNSIYYDVVKLTGGPAVLQRTVYGGDGHNEGSNPYRLISGGLPVTSGMATFSNQGTATYENLVGGQHYQMDFDLSAAGMGVGATTPGFWAHFTMECGNDDLIGYAEDYTPPVPEPMSMVMLGCLGAGMFGARKLRRRKA